MAARTKSQLPWRKYLTREYSFLYISYAIDCYKVMEKVVGTTISYDLSLGDGKLVSLYGLPEDMNHSNQMIEAIAKNDPAEITRKMDAFDGLVARNYELFSRIKHTEDKAVMRYLLKSLDELFLKTLCYYLFFVYLGYAGDFPHINAYLKENGERFNRIRLYSIDADMEQQFPRLFSRYDRRLKSLAPYMSRKELIAYIENMARVDARKKRYLVITKAGKPKEYDVTDIDTALKQELGIVASTANQSQNKTTGRVAYPGIVEGPARLVFTAKDYKKITEGDILITPMTKPSIVPMLSKVKGIITNDGGALSHASIISREMKLPCIVGTDNATDIFKDGDMVLLDSKIGVAKKQRKPRLRDASGRRH